MRIEISKQAVDKLLQVGDSIPFQESGMYIGNGTIIECKDDVYVVELDNRVTENVERFAK